MNFLLQSVAHASRTLCFASASTARRIFFLPSPCLDPGRPPHAARLSLPRYPPTPPTPPTLLSALQAAFNNANSTRLRQSSTLAFSPFPFPPFTFIHMHYNPLNHSRTHPYISHSTSTCYQVQADYGAPVRPSNYPLSYKKHRSFPESAARKVVWSVCPDFALVCFQNELNSEFWGRVI